MRHYEFVKNKFEEFNKHYFKKKPIALYEPIFYAMQSGGKYFRPLLLVYAAELFNVDKEDAILNAYGVELFHNFTLLHDDIMDNSAIRRGKPSVYKQFGLNAGILSGDLMLILALQLASKHQNGQHEALFNIMQDTAVKIHEGQQMDVDFETLIDVDEDEYIKMIEYKTAVLLACALQMGSIIGKANYAEQKKMYEFGRLMGIAFQIQDDYLDSFGDEKVGKKIGGDILNNKKTLLYISALKMANNEQREAILSWYTQKDVQDEDVKIKAVKDLFTETGAKTYCDNLMKEYIDNALTTLESIDTNQDKSTLRSIANKMIQRTS